MLIKNVEYVKCSQKQFDSRKYLDKNQTHSAFTLKGFDDQK